MVPDATSGVHAFSVVSSVSLWQLATVNQRRPVFPSAVGCHASSAMPLFFTFVGFSGPWQNVVVNVVPVPLTFVLLVVTVIVPSNGVSQKDVNYTSRFRLCRSAAARCRSSNHGHGLAPKRICGPINASSVGLSVITTPL